MYLFLILVIPIVCIIVVMYWMKRKKKNKYLDLIHLALLSFTTNPEQFALFLEEYIFTFPKFTSKARSLGDNEFGKKYISHVITIMFFSCFCGGINISINNQVDLRDTKYVLKIILNDPSLLSSFYYLYLLVFESLNHSGIFIFSNIQPLQKIYFWELINTYIIKFKGYDHY